MKKLIEVPMVEIGGELVIAENAKAAAMAVHVNEAAEHAALRAKDKVALEQAVLSKLEAQRDFASSYRTLFIQGKRTDLTSDRTVTSSAENFCATYGFNLRTVQRWAEKLLNDQNFTIEEERRLNKAWQLLEMHIAANYSSDSVEWYTPDQYLDAVRDLFGGIDLDPASSPEANAVVRAKKIFTNEDDGLSQPWHGRIFLNPPYGRKEGDSLAGLFCHKAIREYEAGNIKAGIILVNSLHSQQWQRPLYDYPICFVDHRIKFMSGDGEENKNPTFQNIFVYLGDALDGFAEIFKAFGYVMVRA